MAPDYAACESLDERMHSADKSICTFCACIEHAIEAFLALSMRIETSAWIRGRLAQLVRATGLHPVGRGFESPTAHHYSQTVNRIHLRSGFFCTCRFLALCVSSRPRNICPTAACLPSLGFSDNPTGLYTTRLQPFDGSMNNLDAIFRACQSDPSSNTLQ